MTLRNSSVPTLTLDTDDSLKGIASLFNLCKNVLGRCGPDEVRWTPEMRQVGM